jgi:hypothetical protein
MDFQLVQISDTCLIYLPMRKEAMQHIYVDIYCQYVSDDRPTYEILIQIDIFTVQLVIEPR